MSLDNVPLDNNSPTTLVELEKNIYLCPDKLNKDGQTLHQTIKEQLLGQQLMSCTQTYGYILEIPQILRVDHGIIDDENSGDVIFRVRYSAQTLKPNVNDVVKTMIIMINEIGIFTKILVNGECSPVQIIIPKERFNDDYTFMTGSDRVGFYRRVGDPTKELKLSDTIMVKVIDYDFINSELFYLGEIVHQ